MNKQQMNKQLLKTAMAVLLSFIVAHLNAQNITINSSVDSVYVADDFSSGSSTLVGSGSGIGWSGNWLSNQGSGIHVNTSSSLVYPSGSFFSSAGGYAYTNAGETSISNKRLLTNGINLGGSTTFYVSFLAQKSASGNFRIEGQRSDGVTRYGIGVETDGKLKVNAAGQIVTSDQSLFENEKTYLVVARWDYVGGQADLKMILFEEGEGIPASDEGLIWNHTDGDAEGQTGVVLEQFNFEFTAGAVKIDAFKLGSTWNSVTNPAPIPSSARVVRGGVEQAVYEGDDALSNAIAKVSELQTGSTFDGDTIYVNGTFTRSDLLHLQSSTNNDKKYIIKGEGRDKTFIQAFTDAEMSTGATSDDTAFIYTSKSAGGNDIVTVEFIDLTIRNIRIKEASNALAAVSLGAGTKATFNNVRFTNCDNAYTYGSVLNIPTGVISVEMNNCLIDNNTGKDGTAIYCYNTSATQAVSLTMTDCVVRDNVSTAAAAGLRFWTQGTAPINVTLGNCVFYNNDAVQNASCLELLGAGITIDVINSTFADNLSSCDIYCKNNPKITLVNDLFYGTNQGAAANVIYNASSTFTSDNLTLKNTIMETIDIAYFSAISPENCLFNETIGTLMEAINSNHEIRPKSESFAIDAGIVYSPYTDGFLGNAPDIGAYQTSYTYADLLPVRPRRLYLTEPTTNTVTLNWLGGSLRGGTVILKDGIAVDTVNTTSYTVTGLQANTQHQLGLYVYNSLGKTDTLFANVYGGETISSSQKPYTTPIMEEVAPAAGKRVKVVPEGYAGTNVHHSLYLPANYTAGEKYPVIVEYTGNYAPTLGSTGEIKDAAMGYANAVALNAIWVVMPYLSADGLNSEITWWGSETETMDYCAKALREISLNYGGDPSSVFIIGFSRGALAVNRIGLNDDRASDIWLGFQSHDHYDGQKAWCTQWAENCNYATYKTAAIQRAKRFKGRATLVGQQHIDSVASYLYMNYLDTLALLTPTQIPITSIVPIEDRFNGSVTHTDKWMNYDSEEADFVVNWYKNVIATKPGTYTISGTVTDATGEPVKGVIVESGFEGVDYKGTYTHFAITDSQGHYEIKGLVTGNRVVRLTKAIAPYTLLEDKTLLLDGHKVVNFIADVEAPTIMEIMPEDVSTEIVINTNVVITFSETMDKNTVESSITVSPVITNLTYTWDAETTVVTLSADDFIENTSYTITVGTETADVNGNKLATAYVVNFTTKATVLAITMDEIAKVSLYPNPAKKYFTLNMKQGELRNASFEILDLNGKNILSKTIKIKKGINEIDVSSFKKGLYIVRLNSNTFNYVGKLIVE